MQKLVQKFKPLVLALLGAFLVSCSDTTGLEEANQPVNSLYQRDPISYLNSIRLKSGLNSLKTNEILNKSAKNHAIYTYQNGVESHFQSVGSPNFTGVTPSDRAFSVGYNSNISENISINGGEPTMAVSGLMSAIYHRFAFLDESIDEIGWGEFGGDLSGKISNSKNSQTKNFVFNMGNSKVESFCKRGVAEKGYGKFYSGICRDKTLEISEKNYNRLKSLNYKSYITYPNSSDTKAFFSKESPDPMPECKITSNPVSVEFSKFRSEVKMKSFKLFDGEKEILDTKILDAKNDINRVFSDRQFALFSKTPFLFNHEYRAVFKYSQDGSDKEISWKFRTATPQNEYFVVKDGSKIGVMPGVWYELFFYPDDCNDIFSKYSMSYRFMDKPEILTTDTNMIKIKLDGRKGSKLTLTTENGKKVEIVMLESSNGWAGLKGVFVAVFIALIAIFTLIKSRR